MEQPTFADVEYESKKRRTRREVFLQTWNTRARSGGPVGRYFWNGWMV